jgi:Tol biopolymer transport system component
MSFRLASSALAGLVAALVAWAALAEGPPASARAVWTGPDVNTLGAPSRDGRWISFADPVTGELAVRDLQRNEIRFLTRKKPSQEGEFAYFSTVSPDSKQVAYAWFNSEGFYDLRVTAIAERGEPRVLYRNAATGFVQPCAFSPDGKQVLTLFFRRDNISQIALVSLEDGSVRTLKSLSWIYPKRMDFSPDGRFIVYDNLAEDDAEQRDIFVLAADGSRESRLVEGPANDLFPLWVPDGRSVLFASSRSGREGAWRVPVKDGVAAGEPELVADGLGRFLPMGITREGDLYYGLRVGKTDLFSLDLDSPGKPEPLNAPSSGGAFAPAVSPDGSTLAYLALSGSENFGQEHRALTLASLEDGAAQELPARLAHFEQVRWSPDGRQLLLSGSDRRGRGGLFAYGLESARTEPLLVEPWADFRGIEGGWTRDGESLVAARGGETPALVIRNPKTREDRVLFASRDGARISHPAVSPDGGSVAFAVWSTGGGDSSDVMVYSFGEGRAGKILTLSHGRLADLAWTADSSELLIGAAGTSGALLWRASADGGRIRPLPPLPGRQAGLSAHPGGSRLVVAIGETRSEVWVIERAAAGAPKD